MKEKILKTMLVILLLITMTMANFILLGVNVYTYAVETINQDKATNNKNVEFMSYFKNEKGDILSEYDVKMNVVDLKLYFKVIVKQEGYFNGNVTISNANFNLIEENTNKDIAKIEGNKIFLNQINAGEEKEFEIGINLLKDDKYPIDMLGKEIDITLDGIYRDSKQKDLKVKGVRKINLDLINPYKDNKESPITLDQRVITNKLFEVSGQKKRIVQMQVETGLINNLYPVKNLRLEINVPEIEKNYPETIEVITPENLMMTGKKIEHTQISYDKEKGIIVINIENTVEQGKVNWLKEGKDKFIISCIFDVEDELNVQSLKTTALYNLYDKNKTKYNMEIKKSVIPSEIDSIIGLKINPYEEVIYKGKMYSNRERDFIENIKVQVNALGIATGIKVEEDFCNTKLNIRSKGIRLNKNEIIDILGEDGKIIVKEKTTNKVLSEITKETKENEKGEIIIGFPENIKEIVFEISGPQKIGILNIDKVNVIKNTDKSIVKKENAIEYKLNGMYFINNIENNISDVNRIIKLNESETSARIETNKEELSTMLVNKNLELKVILDSSNEENDLYKNPLIKIALPEKAKDIKLNSVKLLNEDELKIKNSRLNGKTIEIQLENEQTKYKNQTIEGAIILVSVDVEFDKKEKDSIEKIAMTYNNENANTYNGGLSIGREDKEIKIVSYSGLITANNISEYEIENINDYGNRNGKLKIGDVSKRATMKTQIINNEGNKINSINILGNFPTKESYSENNIDNAVSEIRNLGFDKNRIKIYYSENQNANNDINKKENGWSEQITSQTSVKKYLIVLDNFELGEEVNFEYDFEIPANLEYNKIAKQGYKIYYTVEGAEVEQIKDDGIITLETGEGPVAEVELRATVGGENTTNVRVGEMIHYEVVVKNMGTEVINAIKAVSNVPEGTVFMEKVENLDPENFDSERCEYVEVKDKKQVEFNIENLEVGQEIIKEYDVKVIDLNNKTIENSVKIQYGEVSKNSNNAVCNVKKGEISAHVKENESMGEVMSNMGYRFILDIKNIGEKAKKNIKVRPHVSNAKIVKIFVQEKAKNDEVIYKEFDNFEEFTIDKIEANESKQIAIRVIVDDFVDDKERTVDLKADIIVDDETYKTNVCSVNAVGLLLNITNISSSDGGYVKAGDEITYKINVSNNGKSELQNIKLNDVVSNYESILSILCNGKELKEGEYTKYSNLDRTGKVIDINLDLKPHESMEFIVKTIVDKKEGIDKTVEFENIASASIFGVTRKAEKVTHFIEADEEIIEKPEENNKPDDNKPDNNKPDNSKPDNNKPVKPVRSKNISGIAWLDKNDNSQKDGSDELLKGIKVKLFDLKSNNFAVNKEGKKIETVTDENGFYNLSNINEGEYIILFEYDASKYGLVEYKKEGVLEKNNSNVINREWEFDNNSKKVAITEIIKINDKSISNINIGLKELKIFDMKLDKYVSRIVVNSPQEVRTYELGETTLGKADINAKYVNNTNVVVEYKIKVTNEGEIPGYVKKIQDKVSKDYKFNSEMNKNWYKSGDMLENASLSNVKINPGETKEVTLILTKQMTENSTGLINNTAEIVETYNEQGIKDKDSIPGNNVKTEDDMGSADVILSIKTGEIVMVVATIISLIAILSVSAYFIARMIMKKKVI